MAQVGAVKRASRPSVKWSEIRIAMTYRTFLFGEERHPPEGAPSPSPPRLAAPSFRGAEASPCAAALTPRSAASPIQKRGLAALRGQEHPRDIREMRAQSIGVAPSEKKRQLELPVVEFPQRRKPCLDHRDDGTLGELKAHRSQMREQTATAGPLSSTTTPSRSSLWMELFTVCLPMHICMQISRCAMPFSPAR